MSNRVTENELACFTLSVTLGSLVDWIYTNLQRIDLSELYVTID